MLSIYCTAGYPEINSLPSILSALEKAGVDFVEVGMPYSDPLCDGPDIQMSSAQALSNGMSIELMFKQLADVNITMPVVVMGYFNNVFVYGVEKFCADCVGAGVSAVILPDLPMREFEANYAKVFENYGLSFIYLITPGTNEERIREIDSKSTSFIYAVSTSGTTGRKDGIAGSKSFLERLQKLELEHPIMVGFHISKAADLQLASSYTQGGIIGSAFIRHLQGKDDLEGAVNEFVRRIRD